MRKFLAVILAVLTLVSVVLPVSAAEPGVAPDGTVADDAKNLSLIVTEYMSDTKAFEVGPIPNGDTTTVGYNAFQYIEIYNSGDVAVDLYKVAIAVTSDAKDANGDKYWSDLHQFRKKMTLRAGSIYTGVSFTGEQSSYSANKAENPNTAVLEPGTAAVIWFWNDYTRVIASKMTKSPGEAVNGVYHKGFKDFYGMDDDALVLAVYAGTDANGGQSGSAAAACGRFMLNTDSWTTYALIDETGMGANGWTVDTPAWTEEGGYNERVLSLFSWGSGTHIGAQAAEEKATVYVPANTTPDLYNSNTKAALDDDEKAAYTDKTNYVEIDYVDGYKEVALLDFEQAPTPGVIPAWQLAYIAASKGETLDAAAQAAISTFLTANVKIPENVEGGTEDKIDINFKDRSELGNKGQNKKQDNGKGKGLSTLVLVLIIVGGVLLLGGITVVVLLFAVILPKKKKAAASVAAPEADAEEKTEE